jgi:catechol 2,3-dioxygenase-like lactoylglutathione lyase family enzyme
MVKFNGINHLSFVTGDMDLTIRFWRDLLGMRLIAGIGEREYRQYFFELSQNDMIAFFEWPSVEKISLKDHGVPVSGPFGFDHVSFGVNNDKALWDLKDKLEISGFWVSDIIDHGFIHSIYTFDPNNIPIEFSANVKKIDLRRNPKMKDKCPAKAAMEGSEPQNGYWPKVRIKTPKDERYIFPGEGIILSDLSDRK